MQTTEHTPTASVNVDAEFNGIIRANYGAGENPTDDYVFDAYAALEDKTLLPDYVPSQPTTQTETTDFEQADVEQSFEESRTARLRQFGKNVLKKSKENWRIVAPLAVFGTMAGGIALSLVAARYGVDMPHGIVSPEVENMVKTTDILAGGRGDGNGQFLQSIWPNGDHDVVTANYPAQIFPADPGRMDVSSTIGANDIYDKYLAARNNGGDVRIVGYSEGTSPAVEAANRIAAAQPDGKLPSNVKLVLYAPPYGPGGLFDTGMVKGASPMLNMMGIPTGQTVPEGAQIITYDSDLWGNGGAGVNGQPGTTSLRQLLEVGLGGHDPAIAPPPGSKVVTYVENGVTKTVITRKYDVLVQQLMDRGVPVNDPGNFTQAIDDIAPINILPTDDKKPNLNAAIFHGALAADHQIDPSGNTHIVRDMMDQMPPEFRKAGQSGIEAIDTVTDTANKIGNGQMDPVTGVNKIMGELSKFNIDLGNAFPQQTNGAPAPLEQWINNSTNTISQNYGINLGPGVSHVTNAIQPTGGTAEVHTQVNVPIAPVEQPLPAPSGAANINTSAGVPLFTIPEVNNILPPPAPGAPNMQQPLGNLLNFGLGFANQLTGSMPR